jgi:hypothetical protein
VIGNNNLPVNSIVLSGNALLSFHQADAYQWYKNGDVIDLAVSRSYDFNGAAGSYQVVASGATCNVISEPYLVTGAEGALDGAEVYPNPVMDFLHVNLPLQQTQQARIILHDAMGRIVIEQSASETNSFDVRHLNDGIYNLQIVSDASIYSVKIMVRH